MLFFFFNLKNLKVLYFYSGSFVSDEALTIQSHYFKPVGRGSSFYVAFTICSLSLVFDNLTIMCLDMVLDFSKF